MVGADMGGPVSDRDRDGADVITAPSTATVAECAGSVLSPGSSAQSDSPASPLDEVLTRLVGEVGALGRRIDELARLGERREQLLDRLHAENQRLRAGEIAQVQAPLLREIIRSYDLVIRLASSDSAAVADLEIIRRRLLDSLAQAGVRPLNPEPNSPFDASRHEAVQRIETAARELDMTVAYSVRVGFVQDGERVLRPAEVAVHRHRAGSGTGTSASGLTPATESEG